MLWVLIRSAGEVLLISTHNICIYGEIEKIILNYHQVLLINIFSLLYIQTLGGYQGFRDYYFHFADSYMLHVVTDFARSGMNLPCNLNSHESRTE